MVVAADAGSRRGAMVEKRGEVAEGEREGDARASCYVFSNGGGGCVPGVPRPVCVVVWVWVRVYVCARVCVRSSRGKRKMRRSEASSLGGRVLSAVGPPRTTTGWELFPPPRTRLSLW